MNHFSLQAAGKGRLDEVQRLYEVDPARIHVVDGKGKSVLHHAANVGATDIIEFLINKGAGQ